MKNVSFNVTGSYIHNLEANLYGGYLKALPYADYSSPHLSQIDELNFQILRTLESNYLSNLLK